MKTYRLHNITLATDFPLSITMLLSTGAPDVTFTCVTESPLGDDWQQQDAVYASSQRNDDGLSMVCLYRQLGYDVIRFSDVADFYLTPGDIICHLRDPDRGYAVQGLLLGTVLSYWLEQRGTRTIHASAVVINGCAVAFLANSGSGKSTLAAALMGAGHPMLTDDTLSIARDHETFVAHPAYPQMRMWPDQAERLLERYHHLEQISPDCPKRRVPVGTGGLGSFCDSPKPIVRIYQPTTRVEGANSTEIEFIPMSPGQMVMELVRHSFAPNLVVAAGLQTVRLPFFAEMARRIPMQQLRYPRRWDLLPNVCQAIVDDVAGLPVSC